MATLWRLSMGIGRDGGLLSLLNLQKCSPQMRAAVYCHTDDDELGVMSSTSSSTSFGSACASLRRSARCHSSAASGVKRSDPLLYLRDPASWYPLARQMRRRITAHLGPTNSGEHCRRNLTPPISESSERDLGSTLAPQGRRIMPWTLSNQRNRASIAARSGCWRVRSRSD